MAKVILVVPEPLATISQSILEDVEIGRFMEFRMRNMWLGSD